MDCNTNSSTIPRTPTDYHKYPIYPLTMSQWNMLPEEVLCLQTLATFKSQLSKNTTSTQKEETHKLPVTSLLLHFLCYSCSVIVYVKAHLSITISSTVTTPLGCMKTGIGGGYNVYTGIVLVTQCYHTIRWLWPLP